MTAALEFAIIGADGAGVDGLAELLRGHPDVWLPECEEAPVFSHTRIHQRGVEATLRRQGTPTDAARLRGSVNGGYMRGWHDATSATVAARIAHAFPDLRLIALLRDPIERARREHAIARVRGPEGRSFDEAARQLLSDDGLAEGRFLPDDINAYVAQGEYGRILGEYLRYFARGSLCVEEASSLDRAPQEVLGRVLRFLGLSADRRPACRHPHASVTPEPIDAETRARLAAHFAADAEVLHALIGLDPPWRTAGAGPPRRRMALYTAVAGGTHALDDPEVVSPECDYVCFTDDPYLRSDVWRVRPLERVSNDATRPARRARAQARRYLPEYDAARWVDPNAESVGRRVAAIRDEIEDAHTVVLSFPKAGRSWVSYFLARYVAERTGGPLELDRLGDGREFPPVGVVHEHMDVFGEGPAPTRLVSEDLLRQRRIVVLVRDPRDSLVSYWHQKRVRERRPVPARLDLFADCPVYGIERISQGTAVLLDLYDRHPGDKLRVAYEELASDRRRLRAILRFVLGGRPVDERCCRRALDASRFERMRDWERGLTPREARSRYQDRFGRRDLGGSDEAQFKVRRGEVGGFATEMSPELHAHVIALPHTAALLERLASIRGRSRSATREPATGSRDPVSTRGGTGQPGPRPAPRRRSPRSVR